MKKVREKTIAGLLVVLLLSVLFVPVTAQAMEVEENLRIGGSTHQITINAEKANKLKEEVFRQIEEQLQQKLRGRYSPAIITYFSRLITSNLVPIIEKLITQRPAPPAEIQPPPGKPDPQPPRQPEPQLPPDRLTPRPPQERPVPPSPPDDDRGSPGLTADEQLMVNLVNGERRKAGLPDLKVDMDLVKLARLKSRDMIENGYFSHYSPTYGSPFEMMRNAGVSYRYAGENIAGAPTVESAHRNLMNSPGHRANILNPNFTHVGIGIVEGGTYGKMYTQMFIGR